MRKTTCSICCQISETGDDYVCQKCRDNPLSETILQLRYRVALLEKLLSMQAKSCLWDKFSDDSLKYYQGGL